MLEKARHFGGGSVFILTLGCALVLQGYLFFQGAGGGGSAASGVAGAASTAAPAAVESPLPQPTGQPPVSLAAAMPRPTPAVPFLFFHIPKCAGSTLEMHFWRSATAANITYVKPCLFTGTPTVRSVIGYEHYPPGFNSKQEPLPCGVDERQACKAGRRSEVLRISLACSAMIIGHFRPIVMGNLLCSQRYARAESGAAGVLGVPKNATTCAAAANGPFCSSTCTDEKAGSRELASMTCAVSLREPLSRALSHSYHFDYERKMDGTRKCDAWGCKRFSTLPIKEQVKVLTGTGGNVHLSWLTELKWQPAVRWIGRRIMEWVGDGLALLKRCAISIVDRWKDTVALFNAVMPWAEDLGQSGMIVPTANSKMALLAKASKSRNRSGKGFLEEQEALAGSLPALCERLAPDIFFYLGAISLFEHQLHRYNITPAQNREEHVCEPIFRQYGIKLSSRITVKMV